VQYAVYQFFKVTFFAHSRKYLPLSPLHAHHDELKKNKPKTRNTTIKKATRYAAAMPETELEHILHSELRRLPYIYSFAEAENITKQN